MAGHTRHTGGGYAPARSVAPYYIKFEFQAYMTFEREDVVESILGKIAFSAAATKRRAGPVLFELRQAAGELSELRACGLELRDMHRFVSLDTLNLVLNTFLAFKKPELIDSFINVDNASDLLDLAVSDKKWVPALRDLIKTNESVRVELAKLAEHLRTLSKATLDELERDEKDRKIKATRQAQEDAVNALRALGHSVEIDAKGVLKINGVTHVPKS